MSGTTAAIIAGAATVGSAAIGAKAHEMRQGRKKSHRVKRLHSRKKAGIWRGLTWPRSEMRAKSSLIR